MSLIMQRSKEDLETLNQKLQRRIFALPIFDNEVSTLQRRTLRRCIFTYLDHVKLDITRSLATPTSEYVGTELGRLAVDLLSAYARAELPKNKELNLPPSIDLSPSGDFTVTRSQIHNGIPISEDDFGACLDQIKKRVEQDTCDINLPAEIVAKLYLMEIYNEKRSKLPIFKGARNPN